MRKNTIKFTVILMTLGFCFQAFGHVSLNNPVGGETFIAGETVTITWSQVVAHNTMNWDLYFSSDGGATISPIMLDIPFGTLSFEWTVPATGTLEGVVQVVQDNVGMDYEHASLNFTIMVDTEPPAIVNSAQDMMIECSAADQSTLIENWLADNGGAEAGSSCGALNWTNDYAGLSKECGVSGSAEVLFTVTDECDNSSTTSATIRVGDSTPPSIDTAAQNLTVECDGTTVPPEVTTWLENNGGANASDACGSVSWTNDYSGLNGTCGNTGSTVVTFTVLDECGNTTAIAATLTVEDTSPPVVESAAQDIIMECSTSDQQVNIQAWIATHGGAVASDNCGNVVWANNYSGLSNSCGETGSATVVFTMTDDCGNSSTTQAMLTVEDSEPPTIESMAADISVECDDADYEVDIQNWLENIAGATASDFCGAVTWSNDYSEPTTECIDQTSKRVIFTAADNCGNTTTTSADIVNSVSTSVDVLAGLSQLKIYPNPANHFLNVDFGNGLNFEKTLSLFSISGKLVWEGKGDLDEWTLPVSNLNSGIYLLRIVTQDGALSRKIAVN